MIGTREGKAWEGGLLARREDREGYWLIVLVEGSTDDMSMSCVIQWTGDYGQNATMPLEASARRAEGTWLRARNLAWSLGRQPALRS